MAKYPSAPIMPVHIHKPGDEVKRDDNMIRSAHNRKKHSQRSSNDWAKTAKHRKNVRVIFSNHCSFGMISNFRNKLWETYKKPVAAKELITIDAGITCMPVFIIKAVSQQLHGLQYPLMAVRMSPVAYRFEIVR